MIANPIPWPDGARCAVAMTWDMDADSAFNWYNQETADNLVAAQSWTRYDPLIAIPRLVEQFARRDLRLTFFVPGWVIEKYPAQIDLLLKNGHEIALHGYLHERSNEIDKDDELYWLGRGLEAYRKDVGAGPRGWRAPSFAFSKHSLRYLLEAGFEYDSSLMGDDIPYALRDGNATLLEFPVDCEHGVCGAYTVLVDDKPVRSCLMFGCKPRALGCALSRGSPSATSCTRRNRRSGTITDCNAASARRDF